MLCKICVGMLQGGRGGSWIGTYDLTFEHHESTASLRRSREADCSICIALANMLWPEIDLLEDRPISITATLRELPEGYLRNRIKSGELWVQPDRNLESWPEATSSDASLNREMRPPQAHDERLLKNYRLDFTLEKRHARTFLLKEIESTSRELHTPRSLDTSSDEVFGVAKRWLDKCRCFTQADTPNDQWYPKRLIDLEELRNANGLKEIDGLTILSEHGDIEHRRVHLVEFDEHRNPIDIRQGDAEESENFRYVTLSHCWGKPKSLQGQLKLTSKTENRFRTEGIELKELPKTFRDAMLFACRLDKVRYIWIDSLCIKQREKDIDGDMSGAAHTDWLEQSRTMDQIYRKSFLNISATAASDGDQGLFSSRKPDYLWEDEVNVNYSGTNMIGSYRGNSIEAQMVTRCTLIDVSFWDEIVEQAPVNRRGWVLQERLMAPRVLHFCKNQIAWECAGLQDAEGHPEMSPTLKAKLGDVVDEGRLKDLNSDEGLALRHIRLKGFPDPDANLEDLGIFELWKRVIEVYSRTNLTVSRDKLIALSGIARLFSQEKFKPGNRYIAGLWSRHLESQLLWQVNEQFQDGQFANPARRDATRAPSFSWASIDTPYGINYADTTDYKSVKTRAGSGTDVDASIEAMASPGRPRTRATSRVPPAHSLTGPIDGNDQSSNPTNELLFRVCDHSILLSDNDNPFGMIDSAQLLIRPRFLQKIKLHRLEPPLRVPYSWQLDQDPSAEHPKQHSNLYLDAPESDSDIFKHDAELYVMPAAYGERTTRKASRYMYCLLLKFESTVTFPQPPHEKEQEKETKYKDSGAQKNRQMGKYRGFRRFGIAKLSNHADESGQKAVTAEETDETICLL